MIYIVTPYSAPLVLLDGCVDATHKDVGSVEANGASQQPEPHHHDTSVAEIEQRRNKVYNVELVRGEGGGEGGGGEGIVILQS